MSTYTATLFDTYMKELDVDEKPYYLKIYDQGGSYELVEFRKTCYVNVSCFLVCFELDSLQSFKSVENYWR